MIDVGWGGGGGGGAGVIMKEENGLVSLQDASSMCCSNRANGICFYLGLIVSNHGFLQLLLFLMAYGTTKRSNINS